MNKKGIKKIVIPAIVVIVITGGLVVYFVKPQEAQPVMAPLDAQQDLVEEKEEIPEEPQEDTVIDNKEEENEIKNEIVENEVTAEDEQQSPSESNDSINSTHTDIILSDDEYKGDEDTDTANISLTEEEQAMIDEIVAEIMAEYQSTSSSTTQTPGYVSVDAPIDDGVIPEYHVGESGSSDVPAGTIY